MARPCSSKDSQSAHSQSYLWALDEVELVLGPVLRDSSVLFHGLATGILGGRHNDHPHVPNEDTEASEVRKQFFQGKRPLPQYMFFSPSIKNPNVLQQQHVLVKPILLRLYCSSMWPRDEIPAGELLRVLG